MLHDLYHLGPLRAIRDSSGPPATTSAAPPGATWDCLEPSGTTLAALPVDYLAPPASICHLRSPRTALDHLGPLWLHDLGSIWYHILPSVTTRVHSGSPGTALDQLEPLLQHELTPPGTTWHHLRPHMTIWDCSRPSGTTLATTPGDYPALPGTTWGHL